MPASAPVRWARFARGLTATLALGVVVTVAGWTTRAPGSEVYATLGVFDEANLSNLYGFGKFDLATPTGTAGSYSYAWTQLMAPGLPTLANLAMNPVSGSMSLQYQFYQYRTISAGGVISGSLGPTPVFWGMTFDGAGDLHAYAWDEGQPWLKIAPANGQTITSGTFVGQVTANDMYSSFGGNMAARRAGGYFFADEFGQQLVKLVPSGTNALTTVSGSFAGGGYDPGASEPLNLFTSGTSLYLLASNTLYTVDENTAALTRLGTVTGLPTGFSGFTGAASMFAVVPEPGTFALATVGLGAACVLLRRRRR